MSMNETIATPVREARLRLGLTIRELSLLCADEGTPISESQLSKIERGLFQPWPANRAVLAKVLGLDITLTKAEARS